MPNEEIPHLNGLVEAFLCLRGADEWLRFLDDLCTYTELEAMAQRFHVAAKLQKGIVYHAISAESGASTATVSRVARALHHGSGGYRIVLERLDGAGESLGEGG